jgi:hypothetical protein
MPILDTQPPAPEPQGQVGHARAEDHATRVGAEQGANGRARLRDHLVGGLRGREDPALVGVAARAREGGHGLDRRVEHLRAGRPVQAGPAVVQSGETVAVHP